MACSLGALESHLMIAGSVPAVAPLFSFNSGVAQFGRAGHC